MKQKYKTGGHVPDPVNQKYNPKGYYNNSIYKWYKKKQP